MKKYLKMSDVFGGSVEIRSSNSRHVMCDGVLAANCFCADSAEYAAHAINSHDELVEMNKELLAALKRVVGDVRALADHSYGVHGLHQNGDLAPWSSLFSGGFFESWLLSVDDADAVIAKTEGGAA